MPLPKYLQSAKLAMGREVFEQELSEPQALLEELVERVGVGTIENLKLKIPLPINGTGGMIDPDLTPKKWT